jgi:hypothetical protein
MDLSPPTLSGEGVFSGERTSLKFSIITDAMDKLA